MSNWEKWVSEYGEVVQAQGEAVAAAIAAQGVTIENPSDLDRIDAGQVATYPEFVSASESASQQTGWHTSGMASLVAASLVIGGLGTPWATAWVPNDGGYGTRYGWSYRSAFTGLTVGATAAFVGGTFDREANGMGHVSNVTSYMANLTGGAGLVVIFLADHNSEHLFGWMAGLSAGLAASLPAVGFAGEILS